MIILFVFIRNCTGVIFIREVFTSGPLMCSSHQPKHYTIVVARRVLGYFRTFVALRIVCNSNQLTPSPSPPVDFDFLCEISINPSIVHNAYSLKKTPHLH